MNIQAITTESCIVRNTASKRTNDGSLSPAERRRNISATGASFCARATSRSASTRRTARPA